MNWINKLAYNRPTNDDYEFSIIPCLVIGKDEKPNYNGTTCYIGFAWLFWGIYYYYK